jgi:pyridinium-3,5-bisthiocarboxylic acid mononucleotide nickel chelatase
LLNDGKSADVWTTSIKMKKGRSAHTLHCLCTASNLDEILLLFFQNTTTLGVRIQHINRAALTRTIITIPATSCCPLYDYAHREELVGIDVKIGYLNGKITAMKAEYDHCQQISQATGIAIHRIAAKAVEVAFCQLNET